MQPIETKELKDFREFMEKEGYEYIFMLQERREDEIEYEKWSEYAKAYKNFFSKFGETKVTATDPKEAPRKNKYQFVITVQLNDFQSYKLLVRKSTIKRWSYQNPEKAKALLGV